MLWHILLVARSFILGVVLDNHNIEYLNLLTYGFKISHP